MADILIIEDDEETRSAVAELLKLDGHEIVGQATHGAEALALLADGCRPTVILLDLHMPIMDGWEFLAALHARKIAIPVVVFTSETDARVESPCVAAMLRKGAVDPPLLWAAVRTAATVGL